MRGKSRASCGGSVEMPPRRLQIVREAVALKQCIAAPPGFVVHGARGAALRIGGRGRRRRLVTDAAHQRVLGMRRQHLGNVCAMRLGMPDERVRESVRGVHLREPARLGGGIAPLPLGLHVHGLDDVEASAVAPVVGRQVVALQRRVVAVAERNWLGILQPRIGIAAEIPKMVMRVDDREFAFVRHRCVRVRPRLSRACAHSWPARSRTLGW